jgi:hypothetical protein
LYPDLSLCTLCFCSNFSLDSRENKQKSNQGKQKSNWTIQKNSNLHFGSQKVKKSNFHFDFNYIYLFTTNFCIYNIFGNWGFQMFPNGDFFWRLYSRNEFFPGCIDLFSRSNFGHDWKLLSILEM